MTTLALKVARRLHDLAFRAPVGFGRPIPVEAWNRVYDFGTLGLPREHSELGRYALISNHVGRMRPGAAILDVGSGAGLLRIFFTGINFNAYTGIDLSEAAVRQATEKSFPQLSSLSATSTRSFPKAPLTS